MGSSPFRLDDVARGPGSPSPGRGLSWWRGFVGGCWRRSGPVHPPTHGLAVDAGAGTVGKRGPGGGQPGHQLRGELAAVDGLQGATALDQVEGRLVLIGGTEPLELQGSRCGLPGVGHELIGAGCGAGVAAHHHPIRVRLEAADQLTAVDHPIAVGAATAPGAFREADRVEQGLALGCHGEGRQPGLLARLLCAVCGHGRSRRHGLLLAFGVGGRHQGHQ